MAQDNENPDPEAGPPGGRPLFASFRRPAGGETSPRAPEPDPQAAAIESRLASIEKKLGEAAERDGTRALEPLKERIGELERKLTESQEKALALAYELKGREETRRESLREMYELIAAAKEQQQAAAGSSRQHAEELSASRARIEALEQKLTDLSARPEPGPLVTEEFRQVRDKLEALAVRLAASDNMQSIRIAAEELHRELSEQASGLGAKAGELERRTIELEEKTSELGKRAGELSGKASELKDKTGELDVKTLELEKKTDDLEERAREIAAKAEVLADRTERLAAGLPDQELSRVRGMLAGDIQAALAPLAEALEQRVLLAARAKTEEILAAEAKAPITGEEAEKLNRLVRHFVEETFAPMAAELKAEMTALVQGLADKEEARRSEKAVKREAELARLAELVNLSAELFIRFLSGHLERVRETLTSLPPARSAALSPTGEPAADYDLGYIKASLGELERSVAAAMSAADAARFYPDPAAAKAAGTRDSMALFDAAGLAAALRDMLAAFGPFKKEGPGKP